MGSITLTIVYTQSKSTKTSSRALVLSEFPRNLVNHAPGAAFVRYCTSDSCCKNWASQRIDPTGQSVSPKRHSRKGFVCKTQVCKSAGFAGELPSVPPSVAPTDPCLRLRERPFSGKISYYGSVVTTNKDFHDYYLNILSIRYRPKWM
jgi:hypothetical protein